MADTYSSISELLNLGGNNNQNSNLPYSSIGGGDTSSIFGGNKNGGLGLGDYGSILSGLGSIGQSYLGWQGLKQNKKQNEFNNKTTINNMKLQMKALNNQMELESKQRHAWNPSMYKSSKDYMDQHSINLQGIG